MSIEYNGAVYEIVAYEHSKRGRGGALARTKLKHLGTGRVISETFKGTANVTPIYLEDRGLKFLYHTGTGDEYWFMDTESFEQLRLTRDQIGDLINYLVENLELTGRFHQETLIQVKSPTFVDLEVAETRPSVKGDTVSGGNKPARLTTGLVVKVPLFIAEGDRIRVDTRTGTYVERVR